MIEHARATTFYDALDEIQSLDAQHAENGQVIELAWRA